MHSFSLLTVLVVAKCKGVLGLRSDDHGGQGIGPLAKLNVLVASHEGTVLLPRDDWVTCYREFFIGQDFMKHSV